MTASPASKSLHTPFLENAIPDWLTQATAQQREALKTTPATTPDWYQHASAAQRKSLQDAITASFTAQGKLDKAMSALQDIDTFARPLLTQALNDQFKVQLDVDKTFLRLRKSITVGVFSITAAWFEALKLPLLQAALHNFEEAECEANAFHPSSGFVVKTGDEFDAVSTSLTVEQFTGLCRSLDIGAKYQAYLKGYLEPKDAVTQAVLRDKFITAHKTALRVAAEQALLKKDITDADYRMVLSVVGGETEPMLNGQRIWFRDLSLMKHRLTGVVVFLVSGELHNASELLLYIPDDPQSPLKRYTLRQLKPLFKERFTARDTPPATAGSPSAYQRFFSQFVDYADRADYFSQFTQDTPDTTVTQDLAPYAPLLDQIRQGFDPFSQFTRINNPPPPSPIKQVANDDPYLNPTVIAPVHSGIFWIDNFDLWTYLYEQHRAKVYADARSHAVPTAQVDATVRSRKLAALLNIGMLLLTGVSIFVPVLGEVMIAVMAGQLLYETFEGVKEWSEGDRKAAKAHLIDVAENLVLLAAQVGVGRGLAKLTAVPAEPVIEGLQSVTLPNGETRLWRPDLNAYASDVALAPEASPDPQGRYAVNGKTYIRQDGKHYEISQGTTPGEWRIQHPSDPDAYQPLLRHNGQGAWRHTLERPLAWDRLTLLRRLGHATEQYSDEQLLKIADVSGVSDNTLRKAHLDNQPPPPELTDAMRLFEADKGVEDVISQVQTGTAVDERYLYILPLVTELPRWPTGRVLEVFDGPGLRGKSIQYGAERLYAGVRARAPIRMSRADVLGSGLPGRILAVLDEDEITGLLGGEAARVREARPVEFRKQIADFAQTRRAAIFESLYEGPKPTDLRITQLQKACPGLSKPAAQDILAHASAEALDRLESTGKVPLALLEEGRWYARQGRQARAYAGLHTDHIATTDSKRLALHALQKLPGWSDAVRLEIRDEHVGGRLIEAIGNQDAMQRKFLVKKGPVYQAFDERGEALNSLPRYGDNFYASVLHALPDEARQALGVPHVGQQAELQRSIIRSAVEHRHLAPQWLGLPRGEVTRFKPPARIRVNQAGYYASGRGAGMDPSLVTRVQDLYPDLSDEQANGFILQQRRAGQTDAQIYGLLQARGREWETLENTLAQWVATQPPTSLEAMLRNTTAENLRASWRNAPLASDVQTAARLELTTDAPLPPLTADFSHVRVLVTHGQPLEQLPGLFPSVESLHIFVTGPRSINQLETLTHWPRLTRLQLFSPLSAEDINTLGTLSQLEELSIANNNVFAPTHQPRLDVSRLTRLRQLEIVGSQVTDWPVGVQDLPQLERLNLSGTGIQSIPTELLEGHQRLLSGLSLDWSRMSRDSFRALYTRLNNQPDHLIDLEEMVRIYCVGELARLTEPARDSQVLINSFAERWVGHRARFDAIEALSEQYSEIDRRLNEWLRPPHAVEHANQRWMGGYLRVQWSRGLLNLYAAADPLRARPSSFLEVDLRGFSPSSLPELPANSFPHTLALRLMNLRVPMEQVSRFVRAFTQARTVELNYCELAAAPSELQDFVALEHLSLQGNPLTRLEIDHMPRLRTLNLRETNLQQVPTGLEDLAQLTSLNLRNTRITVLPEAILTRDELLLSTNVVGTPLSQVSEGALAVARQRVETARGLPAGALERFAYEEPPTNVFPEAESGASLARHLLDLPTADPGLPLPQRLQRLQHGMDEQTLQQWLTRLRAGGASDTHLHALIDVWNEALHTLIRQLNGWLYTRGSPATDWSVASRRNQAAQRIVTCWRQGLASDPAGQTLSFNGLQLDNLPVVTADFSHVHHLDLSGLLFAEQGSNGFLAGFSNLRTLRLTGNELQGLPRALAELPELRELDLSSNRFDDELAIGLDDWPHLQQLNLSDNLMEFFSLEPGSPLEVLNLSGNRLTDWPAGTLEAGHLRTLNLSANDISAIPTEALDGSHDALMEGTDISDNPLSHDSLTALIEYLDRTGRDSALGLSRRDIQTMLDDGLPSSPEPDEIFPEQPDEELPAQPALPEQPVPWIDDLPLPEQGRLREIWTQLQAEPDHQAFFHLLERLQDTTEFGAARADLSQRVRNVLEAAADNSELRQALFAMSHTHGTCVDGRILTFSGLEVRVYEHNALLNVDAARLDLRGAALLNLSRQLFRLGRAEVEADRALVPHSDVAEVRLSYRIGLARGWPDQLELPGQPRHMRFSRPITGTELADARRNILDAERSEVFYEDLISRDYWVDYLKQRYADEFATLKRNADARQNALEDAHQDFDDAYLEALNRLEIEQATERNLKLLELSRREVAELTPHGGDHQQPGASRPQ
ncbi:hypothetical protein BLL37_19145 [Pseudomonas azotoformans]|uniref:RING-type E3 ubiquitin transferase n=1 Tax=Pseudomonas azotoformans TaxID=47878 RepID=A0A1V2JEX2_PSEAZ|nr:DUF6543 domain-containing protein [Pseudomonas azotoformans]OIN51911.1 hypothetical protein BFL39_04380 [Pseudomonas azotoformans]ONH43908.1 hypothetical protein BLL37_19145 [Pseudomonas azotoformans]SDO59357.1 Leucine rich repeat-containing protein [Pseudomonas azotoformans]